MKIMRYLLQIYRSTDTFSLTNTNEISLPLIDEIACKGHRWDQYNEEPEIPSAHQVENHPIYVVLFSSQKRSGQEANHQLRHLKFQQERPSIVCSCVAEKGENKGDETRKHLQWGRDYKHTHPWRKLRWHNNKPKMNAVERHRDPHTCRLGVCTPE